MRTKQVNSTEKASERKNQCRVELRLKYSSVSDAQHVHSSTETDNDGFVKARVEGTEIIAEILAENYSSLLHTMDDYLACVSVAEKIIMGHDIMRNRKGKDGEDG